MVAWLIANADATDTYCRVLRKLHSHFGTGTLMLASAKHPQAARVDCFDDDFLDAFSYVIKALTAKKAHHPL
jgi:hypothetical protein